MAFVFDFGAVLFNWQPERLLQQCLPQRATDAASASHWVSQIFQGYGGDWAEFDRGTVTVPELRARIGHRTGLSDAEVQALLDAVPNHLAPLPASVALVERLHANGQPLHYLSNMPAPYADHLERSHAVVGRFRSGVFSARVQLVKPDPAIFAHAADRFGHAPEELVFLDDSPRNIQAAQQAGWRALLFRNAEQALADLQAQGWWPEGA